MTRYTDIETKRKLLSKLIHPCKKDGCRTLRTDDIAKHMDISKATLYKYFSSKDEIIEGLVELITDYFRTQNEQLTDASLSRIERFQTAFEQMLLFANYVSDTLQNDLRETYPELLEKIRGVLRQRDELLRAFYEEGMKEGAFHPVNPTLLIVQDELVFQHIIDPKFLMEKNLTFRTALFDYYDGKVRQLFPSSLHDACREPAWCDRLDHLVRKVAGSMI